MAEENLAFLYLPGGLRLTPHYDLVSTEVYPDLERALAMKLGRAWDVRNVQRSDWLRFAEAVDVPWERVRLILLELAALTRSEVPRAIRASQALFGSSPIYHQVAGVVARHTASLERALGAR